MDAPNMDTCREIVWNKRGNTWRGPNTAEKIMQAKGMQYAAADVDSTGTCRRHVPLNGALGM